MGLIVVLNLVSALLPVIMGYSINFYTIFLGLILIILKTNLIRNLFFAITPLILLFDPNVYWINLVQVFVEYFLAIWCFFPLLFGGKIIQKFDEKQGSLVLRLFIFSSLFILSWIFKLLLHTLAGYFWWTDHDWWGSLFINLPIIVTNIVITIPIFVLIFNKTIQISKTYYLNIWNDTNL